MEKPLIVFDTDMDTDCDDAGALGMLLRCVQAGEADLLGVIADAPAAFAAPCCEAICAYYGVSVPVGAVYESTYQDTERFASYYAHREGIAADRYYNAALGKRVGKRDADYRDAASLYRELLTNAPDHSVTVVAVGLLTALSAFLETDENVSLFAQKVKRVVSMGDATYPGVANKNFNYSKDRIGAHTFFERCPVSVYVCPDGKDVITGQHFSAKLEATHPLRVAYEMWCEGEGRGRSSWDLITVLFALQPHSSLFEAKTHGTVRYDTTNRTYWETSGNRVDYDLHITVPPHEMAQILESKLI